MSNPLVTINLVVFNGQKYIRSCLNSLKNQIYPFLEVNVFDNGSTDGTKEIIESEIENFSFIKNETNLGTWGGQEEALKYSTGKYIIALSVDVILDPRAIEEAVKVMEKDETIGALQGKIYQYQPSQPLTRSIIDTVGFQIERSRRIINIGHGEKDRGQYDEEQEIFGVEGAAPVFRRAALEDCRINGRLVDEDMFWYGDDLDLAWRMHLFGWKQIYHPRVIMHHDRSTTKGLSRHWSDYFRRIKDRRKIPAFKRGLDWRNKRLARLKNDFGANVIHDLFCIAKRELAELCYILVFEPVVLPEVVKFIKLIPKTLKKRKKILAKARLGPRQMQPWFT